MAEFFARLLLRLGIGRRPVRSRHDKQQRWQEKWSDQNREAPWMNRGISPEIVEAVASGWFPAGATALDIGCGEGEVAAWMAEHGFPSVGVDIAPAAVARAQARFNEVPGRLEFFAVDVCEGAPPDRQYRVLIDRGCFHTIQPRDYADWLEHLLHVSAPDAKLLLLCRAFRDGIPQGDPHERRRVTASVEQGFGRGFRIVRSADTYLDPFDGRQADKAMGGEWCSGWSGCDDVHRGRYAHHRRSRRRSRVSDKTLPKNPAFLLVKGRTGKRLMRATHKSYRNFDCFSLAKQTSR